MSPTRYQVFVSSTFADLQEERRSITEQLLKIRAIPAGMELFTASGRPPWSVIEQTLEDTDYMILVLAGRYGSLILESGVSYTESEYDYAVQHGIPVLAFLHQDLGQVASSKVDSDPDTVARRDAFWAKVRDSGLHTVDFWTDTADLTRKALAAVTFAITDQPRSGWVRRSPHAGASGQAPSPTPSQSASPDHDTTTFEDHVRSALDQLSGLPFLLPTANFNPEPGAELRDEINQRIAQLEKAAQPLVELIAKGARTDRSGDLNQLWVELVEQLAAQQIVGGAADLVHLLRAPAALTLHTAGVGALVGRRQDLAGLLLSPKVQADDPYGSRERPANSILGISLMYSTGWPAKQFGAYLLRTLSAMGWQASMVESAWERWQYLSAVAKVFDDQGIGAWPYLRIQDLGQGATRPVISQAIRREIEDLGDRHPLLSHSLCDGRAELFLEAAETFDNAYGEWGSRQDWGAAEAINGRLRVASPPTRAPHFPGERPVNS